MRQESSCPDLLFCCMSPLGMAWQCIISLKIPNLTAAHWHVPILSTTKESPQRFGAASGALPLLVSIIDFLSLSQLHVFKPDFATDAPPCSFFLLHLGNGVVVFEPAPFDGRCCSCVASEKSTTCSPILFCPLFKYLSVCILHLMLRNEAAPSPFPVLLGAAVSLGVSLLQHSQP